MSPVARIAVVVAVFLASACGTSPAGPERPAWEPVPPPAPDARVLGFAPLAAEVRAFGSVPGAEGRAPGAWTWRAGRWEPMTLHARSGYARQAELTVPAIDGDRILALGSAFGGAHGNPRPTIWTGGPAALDEYPQGMELLGGPRAITVTGSAAGPSTYVLSGQWDHPRGGAGAAVWVSADGAVWSRLDDDPALLSTEGARTRILATTRAGDGFVAVGDVRSERLSPTAWTSGDGRSWRREALPADGSWDVSAWRITCRDSCVAVGVAARPDGGPQRLACWQRDGTAWRPMVLGGPEVPRAQLLEVTGLSRDAGISVVTGKIGGKTRLWRYGPGCEGPAELPLPEDTPEITAFASGGSVLLATTGRDSSKLWRQRIVAL
ncbi:hypothetical protein ACFWY9_17225 [Amycolatopsis sp. NPDC059027]|uniref:hypothetical protein n=1 Tax=Amycolatopsis sp. NPDC059027 TaxID=3346709 RepID=UPI00366F5915